MAGRLPKHLLRRPSSVVVGDLPTCAAIQRGNNCWLANECPQNEVAKVLLRARRKSFSVPWPMYKPRRTRLVALIDHLKKVRLFLADLARIKRCKAAGRETPRCIARDFSKPSLAQRRAGDAVTGPFTQKRPVCSMGTGARQRLLMAASFRT